ncbi:hypothetical protein LSAT2_029954 [Lamellibrachia satsuma]|nr:hypothetical protein LSAT2_029954 [Lamellibrachia satsuma]
MLGLDSLYCLLPVSLHNMEFDMDAILAATSSAPINPMAEHRISCRKRRSIKPDVITTTFFASNVRRKTHDQVAANNSNLQDKESRDRVVGSTPRLSKDNTVTDVTVHSMAAKIFLVNCHNRGSGFHFFRFPKEPERN